MDKREEVWLRAFVALAGAFNVREEKVAIRWADECLKAFDERFPKKPDVRFDVVQPMNTMPEDRRQLLSKADLERMPS